MKLLIMQLPPGPPYFLHIRCKFSPEQRVLIKSQSVLFL